MPTPDTAPFAHCRVVSFDACDTIIRTEPPYAEQVFRACDALGFDVTRDTVHAICRRATAATVRAQVHAWREERRLQSGAFFETWRRAFRGDPRWPGLTDDDFDRLRDALGQVYRCTARMPHVEQVLRAVRDAGRTLVVTSNYDCTLTRTLEDFGLARYFDAIVASEEVGSEKPDTAIFHAALARVGARPAEAVHVGDGLADFLGAQRAGLCAVWLRPEIDPDLTDVPEPDASIASLPQLLPLLGIDAREDADAD